MNFNALRLRGFRVQACQCLEHVLCLGGFKASKGPQCLEHVFSFKKDSFEGSSEGVYRVSLLFASSGGMRIVGGLGGLQVFVRVSMVSEVLGLGVSLPRASGFGRTCWSLIEIVASVKPLQPCHVSSHKYYGPNVGLRGFIPVAACVADRGLQIKAGHGLRRKTFCQTSNLSKSRSRTNSLIQIQSMNSRRKTLATE